MDDKGRGFDSRHLHHENGLAPGGEVDGAEHATHLLR